MSSPKLFICEQSAIARGGHYLEYTGCIARAAIRQGMHPIVLCNNRLDTQEFNESEVELIPIYKYTWGENEANGLPPYGPGHMVFDTEMALIHCGANLEDHLLIHTLGLAELQAWLEYLVEQPLYRLRNLPTIHLLMRFDPGVWLDEPNYQLRRLQDRLTKRSILLSEHVHFASDTKELADQYAKLLNVLVDVAPIPFEQSHLKEFAHLPQQPKDKPLTVLYLGDARLEKGFESFPDLVRKLWESHLKPHRLRFVFQANTNVPGGEGNIAQAIRTLAQYPPARVEIIQQPMAPQDYFHRLAESDIVLLPYDASRYRWRSSGILVEALAAGKPVITTKGSWMAGQVANSHAVLIDNLDELPSALARLVEKFPAAQKEARQLRRRWLGQSSPDHYIDWLTKNTPIAKQVTNKDSSHVLFIMDGDAMVLSNGASRVARRQLDYLFSRKIKVTGVFIATHFNRSVSEIAAWSERLSQRLLDDPFASVHMLMINPAADGGNQYRYLLTQSESAHFSIQRDIRLTEALNFPATLYQSLKDHRPDAVLLNYVTYRPLLNTLGLDDVPVICETHDIQSFQKAIYGDRNISVGDVNRELALLRQCQYLISLNDVETEWLKEHLPGVPCATVPMMFAPQPVDESLLVGYADLAELVAACGPEDLDFQSRKSAFDMPSPMQQKLIKFGNRLDLLYVSSAHQSNVSGLKWFIEKCFIPLLAPKGMTMIVAGGIKHAHAWPTHPNLAFIGKIEDVAPLYAATCLCVLPITEGAGSPIKTIEAIAYGKLVVGTGLAFRGLPAGLLPLVYRAEDEETFAAVVERLVADPDQRELHAEHLRSATGSICALEAYQTAMDKALQTSIGFHSRTVAVKSMPAKPLPRLYCEWDQWIQAANQLLCGWLGKTYEGTCTGVPRASEKLQAALRRLLPQAIEYGPLAIPDTSAKSRLLADPATAIEAMFVVGGIKPLPNDRTPHRVFGQLVVSSIARNILVVQLIASAENTPPPRVETMAGGRRLEPIGHQRKGENLLLHYQVPAENGLSCLWPIAISIELDRNSPWQIGKFALRETLAPATLKRLANGPKDFHGIEHDSNGNSFLWTAAQTIQLDLPLWRGTKKNLVLECHSTFENQAANILLDVGKGFVAASHLGKPDSGLLCYPMSKIAGASFSRPIRLKTSTFRRASESDDRQIGIALLSITAISQCFH